MGVASVGGNAAMPSVLAYDDEAVRGAHAELVAGVSGQVKGTLTRPHPHGASGVQEQDVPDLGLAILLSETGGERPANVNGRILREPKTDLFWLISTLGPQHGRKSSHPRAGVGSQKPQRQSDMLASACMPGSTWE